MSAELTAEEIRELLEGVTPEPWQQHVQPDGSLIVTAARVPDEGEDVGGAQPVYLLASEMGSRSADLFCAAPALARTALAALARAEAVERREAELREALEGLVYLNDHPPATDHERALSAAMSWRQARAALARPAAAEAGAEGGEV